IKTAFFVRLGYLAYRIAGFVGLQFERIMRERQKDLNNGLFRLIRQSLQILALLFCLLLGAQNMGMDVASLIAGLGIGGLAFALAAKDTLANLLGSVMIMIDRPFRIGDYILAKGVEGSVEEIGFRSTRIRTPHNSLLSIPNCELVLANIDNMGGRDFRRAREVLGLDCATSPAQVETFCHGIRTILQANPAVKQDAITVAFTAMAASSLEILVNYHLKVATWNDELANRQAVLIQIMQLARDRGISFAYPTQTLHIGSLPTLSPTQSGSPAAT
ncbi:MAG: mechanosensitive ion channel family protein, partial [Planctomycetota bacterium]